MSPAGNAGDTSFKPNPSFSKGEKIQGPIKNR